MTLLSITKWFFWYFKAISLNEQTELFVSVKYSVCLKPAHLTWSGTYTVVWKNKRLIQLCTDTVNLLLRKRLLGENTDVCPWKMVTACWDFSDSATHSSCPTYPGHFLSWGRSNSTRQPAEKGSTSNVGIKFVLFSFLLTGHRMVYGAEEPNTNLFPLQT